MIVNVSTVLSSILFIVVLFSVTRFYWKRRWLYYYGSKIPGPFAFPLLGCVQHVLKGRYGLYGEMMKICEKYKPISRGWMGHYLFICVTKPEDIELLLKKCLNKGKLAEFLRDVVGDGLLLAQVEKWKRHRKYVNMTFSQASLNSYFDVIVKYANKLVDDLHESCDGNNQIDIYTKFGKCTLGLIIETSMGLDPNDFHGQYLAWIVRSCELTLTRFSNPFYYIPFVWKMSAAGKELSCICEKMRDYVKKIIETKRRQQLENKTTNVFKDGNFLDRLIKITDEEGKWTVEELMGETQNMVTAGSSTTAITQSFVTIMLAMHHAIQEKACCELSEIFQSSNRDVTLEDLDRMVYLEQVIKETMRLFAIIPVLPRSVDEDFVLDSHVMPKGSILLVPIAYVHKDPEVWCDPLKFDPDRFLPSEVAKRHRYSYLPFGMPPRNCIGMKFAMMSMKVTLATILRRFKLISSQYKSIEDIDLHIDITLMAPRGYQVTLESR